MTWLGNARKRRTPEHPSENQPTDLATCAAAQPTDLPEDQIAADRSTDVCPRRLQERRTKGAINIPNSSIKTMVALSRAAFFFYPGPVLCDPGPDALLVALERTSGRLLWREAQSV